MNYNDVIYNNSVSNSMTTDYRREREKGREALRLGILDAAGRLLAEEGPQALSMRRIAKEVNASTQVLYTMFGGKDGLANELFVEGFERLAEAERAVPVDDDPLRYVRDLGDAYVENALANPNYYRVMFSSAIPGFKPSEEALARSWQTFEPLVEAVRECAHAGLFDSKVTSEAREAALSLWAAAHGVVSLHLSGHLPDENEARRVFAATRGAVLESLLIRKRDTW